jgi:hypothetical protein
MAFPIPQLLKCRGSSSKSFYYHMPLPGGHCSIPGLPGASEPSACLSHSPMLAALCQFQLISPLLHQPTHHFDVSRRIALATFVLSLPLPANHVLSKFSMTVKEYLHLGSFTLCLQDFQRSTRSGGHHSRVINPPECQGGYNLRTISKKQMKGCYSFMNVHKWCFMLFAMSKSTLYLSSCHRMDSDLPGQLSAPGAVAVTEACRLTQISTRMASISSKFCNPSRNIEI